MLYYVTLTTKLSSSEYPASLKYVDMILIVLKSDSHLPKKVGFAWFYKSPLKITNNAFYFILKSFFVLKIFLRCFCPDFFGKVEKWLDNKTKVIFEIYGVTN